ncbi:LacI family transcriptional regulator [Microbacterium sp. zg.B48]|uniref:LacI family DNA-binding transcriptional regulator n=1 Tax=unclassified Microbacterium TaxID=2609290 RepID=UPI00214AD19B|nr:MULTISPECIES: LacI family DNA-binding transcriptional regulator [unclassified Microbacterium]MCR2763926.1 LacI family transcriptional regulator [Microbacterium sp. zg.B48]MCR2810349.1 LacI family transcriptional regulator [Microbacterium sp. zg.B185]WIM18406.1 LacI family DNA-binding transcriptional regulator [Microbacterium sp. zg-B185]
MSGISDVARLAGVSKSTASRALSGGGYVSEKTRLKVAAVAASLDYVPSSNAASLVTGRTRNVGVVIPYLHRWFFAEVLEGIQAALLERGLDLTLYDANPGTEGRRRIFEDFLARKRFDGLIAVGLEPEDHELERLLKIGRPVVSVVGTDAGTTAIGIDDNDAARRATHHLTSLGHEHIAFIGGGSSARWASVDRRRLDGYRHAMAEAGLAARAKHITSEVSLPGGYGAAVDLLADRARPTGIVAVCDEVAIGAIIAARRLGIGVPSDLSVVGIDDHKYAEMFALTTFQQRPREQGRAAVELLEAQLADAEAEPAHVALTARLIVRASTGPVDADHSVMVSDARGGMDAI